jgi:hypothetical protein
MNIIGNKRLCIDRASHRFSVYNVYACVGDLSGGRFCVGPSVITTSISGGKKGVVANDLILHVYNPFKILSAN